MPRKIEPKEVLAAVKKTTDSDSLVEHLLRDLLDWNIPQGFSLYELTYHWSAADLRAANLEKDVVDSRILQLADLHPKQPWGIFIVEFKKPDAVRGGRGLTGTLRKILRGLVESRTKNASLPSWKREHLLFICTHDYKDFRFAYFKNPTGDTRTAPLATFGWGVDRPSQSAFKLNLPHLVWPDESEDAAGWVDDWSKAFDVERVTKKFYDEYKDLHDCFVAKAQNVKRQSDRPLLASVVLNRLMFVYFLQRRGFLDNGDPRYLENRFEASRKSHPGRFCQRFLSALFFEGLAKQNHSASVKALIGDIRYLNGGLFVRNPIEQEAFDAGKPVDWPDESFAAALNFFGRYSWNLDDTASGDDNEINPDVLGYIFERYINDRADMGAYYTKEDITGYISKNAIIPFLLDHVAEKCPDAFAAGGAVWSLLKKDPSRYIYPSVRRGVLDGEDKAIPLPSDIAAGQKDITRRITWNRPAVAPFALPTETWREHVARRERCLSLHKQLAAGQVARVNDLITLNLDITRFMLDVIASADAKLLHELFEKLKQLSVLDPTCGSGAFLFAALNLLASLYDACLARMQALIANGTAGEHAKAFKATLARVADHASHGYFVAKSVIVNNLYGVDLMKEAVEICKLRLFLRLVGQVERAEHIEPLPDIDFNVQHGNTLVGFAKLEDVERAINFVRFDFEKAGPRIAKQADAAHQKLLTFIAAQNADASSDELGKDKDAYRKAIKPLRDELDGYLATQNGLVGEKLLEKFRSDRTPFHWCADFFGAMNAGGFDVIVGNPPYVATSGIDYLSKADVALRLPDIYGHVLLRTLALGHDKSRFGMIVPLSLTFSKEFTPVRKALTAGRASWVSSYDNIPAAVFHGVSQRCTIWLGGGDEQAPEVTPMYRWRSVMRPYLVENVAYTTWSEATAAGACFPKLTGSPQTRLLDVVSNASKAGETKFIIRQSNHKIRFSQSARNFISVFKDEPPCLDATTLKSVASSKIGELSVVNNDGIMASLAVLGGELYFWFWLTVGDGFDVTGWVIGDFLKSLGSISNADQSLLTRLGRIQHARRNEGLVFKKNAGKYVGNFNFRRHGWLTRRADLVLLAALGVDRETAIHVFEFVQRTLAINVSAGEKAIPAEVKARYKPPTTPPASEAETLQAADQRIIEHFGFSKKELTALTTAVPLVGADEDE